MKVVISARDFVFDGCDAVERLQSHGFEVKDITGKEIKNEDDYYREISDADAVINAFEPMSRSLIERCNNLKIISVRGVGYDYIDAAACKEKGIAIARTVGTVGAAVAEQAMAFILHFARQVARMNESMQAGRWERIMTEGTAQKTLGIIGFGEIGQALAKRAAAFDMRILYHCITPKPTLPYTYVDLNTLLSESDYIVLALPLTEDTCAMIDTAAFRQMKSGAVLINVARAGIVDTAALRDAVTQGVIRGAAVDVYESEPCTDSVLRGVENILLTPHTAPLTKNNFIAMNRLAAENILRFFDGTADEKYLV